MPFRGACMDLECLTLAIYSFTLTSQDWKITLVEKYYFCPDIKIFQRHFEWKKTLYLEIMHYQTTLPSVLQLFKQKELVLDNLINNINSSFILCITNVFFFFFLGYLTHTQKLFSIKLYRIHLSFIQTINSTIFNKYFAV